MNSDHIEFDLLENALDSLFEAYKEFESAEKEKNVRRYKFVIIHVAHFLELFLKQAIYSKNEILIYREHYKRISQKSKTISLKEAIEVLSNLGMALPDNLRNKAGWLYNLRNDVMHFKFKYSPEFIKETIPKILKLVIAFDERNNICNILNIIKNRDRAIYSDFLSWIDTYEEKLAKAMRDIENEHQREVNQLRPEEMQEFLEYWEQLECEECGNETFIRNENSPTGYQCTFCGNQEASAIEVRQCLRCDESVEARYMQNGLCDYCAHMLSKDD